jgi:segregation and condensation protein B
MPTMSEAPSSPAVKDMNPVAVQRHVEAVLLTVDRPIAAGKLAEVLDLDTTAPIRDAVGALNAFYDEHELSFRIEQVAGGYQLMTRPQYKPALAQLHRTKEQSKLSPASMETLAIIAYRQPILRADVEAIRGVSCGEVIRSLMDKNLVKITGRADEIGRPMLYGTTRHFLEVFGLASLKDLPKAEELNQA